MNIKFKNDRAKQEFFAAPALVQQMGFEFDWISSRFGIHPVITRIKSEVEGDSGVHADYRAIDFRDEYGGELLYRPEIADAVCKYMNAKFPRLDGLKTCIHHRFKQKDGSLGPLHFHVQAPSRAKTNMFASN
jgi:hypothetical protein